MSERVNQINAALKDWTLAIRYAAKAHDDTEWATTIKTAARERADLLTRLEDGSLVLTELVVHYDSLRDRYVLALPENYPQGPKWMEGGRINSGDLMTVVISKDGTGFDLAALGLQEDADA